MIFPYLGLQYASVDFRYGFSYNYLRKRTGYYSVKQVSPFPFKNERRTALFPVGTKKISSEERLPEGIFGRTEEQMDTFEQIHMRISEAVRHRMEDRGIQEVDVQRTIHHAETTGEKFVNPSTGRFLTSFRPGRVTFWVEYSEINGEYEVHTAYSHRMEMKRGPDG